MIDAFLLDPKILRFKNKQGIKIKQFSLNIFNIFGSAFVKIF